jgi:hypothetical protein
MFGVTLWEMFSCGATPYQDMSMLVLIEALDHGFRLPRPKMCTINVYDVILACWRQSPMDRPLFEDIVDLISNSKSPQPADRDMFDTVTDHLRSSIKDLPDDPVNEYEYQDEVKKFFGPEDEGHEYEYQDLVKPKGSDGGPIYQEAFKSKLGNEAATKETAAKGLLLWCGSKSLMRPGAAKKIKDINAQYGTANA